MSRWLLFLSCVTEAKQARENLRWRCVHILGFQQQKNTGRRNRKKLRKLARQADCDVSHYLSVTRQFTTNTVEGSELGSRAVCIHTHSWYTCTYTYTNTYSSLMWQNLVNRGNLWCEKVERNYTYNSTFHSFWFLQ